MVANQVGGGGTAARAVVAGVARAKRLHIAVVEAVVTHAPRATWVAWPIVLVGIHKEVVADGYIGRVAAGLQILHIAGRAVVEGIVDDVDRVDARIHLDDARRFVALGAVRATGIVPHIREEVVAEGDALGPTGGKAHAG